MLINSLALFALLLVDQLSLLLVRGEEVASSVQHKGWAGASSLLSFNGG
jgi:hypothetical protein